MSTHSSHSPNRAQCIAAIALVALLSGCAESERGESVGPAWQASSDRGLYEVEIAPRNGTVEIGGFTHWTVRVTDASGNAVHPARITLSGGMPGHGHGLPSQPQVTEHLGDGRYLIEGMQFNMAGAWIMVIGIDTQRGADRATVELELEI